MAHPLGDYITTEVSRSEADFATFRTRGQGVLAISSGLVTALGAILAFAVSSQTITIDGLSTGAAAVALIMFIAAAVFVLLMFRPSVVSYSDPSGLRSRVDEEWTAEGWDRTVAVRELDYLISLRASNSRLANLLAAAILAQNIGIGAVALMSLLLLDQA